MPRVSGCCWVGWALCLCASLATGAQQDFVQDGDAVRDLTREDGTGSEPGAELDAKLLRCNKASWRVPGQYLVVLRQDAHDTHVQRTVKKLTDRAARRGFPLEILQTYSGALHGFLAKMNSDALHLALKLPHLLYIEEDSYVFAQSAPWNLQRLLQPHGLTSENGTYQPPNDGGTAEVYLMDGSVQSSHRELERRVLVTDFSNIPEEDGVRIHRQGSQCDSHGTHIAGVVSGSDSGVAPGASVKLVRVLNCQGKGTVSGALAGMEYIRANLLARPMDAVVVLLPFVGGFSASLNAASRNLVTNGAVVVAAAGNYRDDACLYSPASEPEVITVGAVNAADQLMSQGAGGTNFGRCVDLFAPGDDIVSASSDCSTCFTTRSGTSQAAAHVAGIAAVILSSKLSPVHVLQTMLRSSISDTINLLPLSDRHHLNTPNLVAAMPPAISTREELLCRSAWSDKSGLAMDDSASVSCRRGEEMMGCKSYATDDVHDGERVTMQGTQMQCVAKNGPRGKGVYAVARCCTLSGLRCRARASPEPGTGAAGCVDPEHHLTGCASPVESSTHADPRLADGKRCNGDTALCCHAPALECRLLENTAPDEDHVEVSCPSGWTLTECSAVTGGAGVLVAVAKGDTCHVRGATGPGGGTGLAVCCRVGAREQFSAAT